MFTFMKKYSIEILFTLFIILILTAFNLVKAQTGIGKWYTGSGDPVGRYNLYKINADYYRDRLNNHIWYSPSVNVWTSVGYLNDTVGGGGSGGLTSFNIGTVTTLGQAQQATATLNNLGGGNFTLDLGLTRGYKGTTGAAGTNGINGNDGDRFTSTSVTSNSIGTGSKTFTIEDSLSYVPAQPIIISNSATDFMTGTVTSYNETTGVIVLNITSTTGSGTFASWYISLSGIQGPPGPRGFSGGGDGWLGNVLTSPDKYGAVHAATTFAAAGYDQSQVDSGWGAAGALTTDMIDWGAWQMAVIEACDEQKAIHAYGTYYVNKSIQAEKYFVSLQIEGNYCRINTTNTNAFTVFGRPSPADNNDALLMTNAKMSLRNIIIAAGTENDNQVGVELGPSYNNTYDGVWVTAMRTGIHLRFSLNTIIRNCQAFSVDSGFIADMGNWSGASNSNSQSNVTTFEHCRVYCDDLTSVAFGVFAASGCRVNDCIVEGGGAINGIKYDALGSVNVYYFWVNNFHFECVYGATNAAIKVKGLGGMFELNGAYGQYPAILLDVEGTQSDFNVKITNVISWVPVSGKYYRKRGTSGSWFFDWNDALYFDLDDIKNKFTTDNGTGGTAGVQPNKKTLGVMGQGNGYIVIPSPR